LNQQIAYHHFNFGEAGFSHVNSSDAPFSSMVIDVVTGNGVNRSQHDVTTEETW
jgi:hypothetical protein